MDIMIHIYKIFGLTSYTFCLSILYVSVRWAKPSLDPWYPLWQSPKSTNTARLETNPFQEHGMGERRLRLLIDFSQMIYHPFMIQFPASITMKMIFSVISQPSGEHLLSRAVKQGVTLVGV